MEGFRLVGLDAKGRFAVPAGFRAALSADEGSLHMTVEQGPCLQLYVESQWRTYVDYLKGLPIHENPEAMRRRRMVLGYSEPCRMDSNHRLSIKNYHLQHLRLDDPKQEKLVMAGLDDYIEIWRESDWARQRDAFMNDGPLQL